MTRQNDPEILRQRLAALPSDTLADALLNLSQRSSQAEAMVTRLTATPQELIKRINSRLAGIRRRRKFLFRSQAPELAQELSDLLTDIRSPAISPLQGMKLAAKFLQLDVKVFELCDDSYGAVGAVFHGEFPNLFWSHAGKVDKEQAVVELLLSLLEDDPWDVRSDLLDQAPEFLSASAITLLVDKLWQKTRETRESDAAREHWALCAMLLARACGDPDRYREAALIRSRRPRNTVNLTSEGLTLPDALETARLLLQRGQAAGALELAEEIMAKGGRFHRQDCLALMQEAHKALGNTKEEAALARRQFDDAPSAATLDTLVAVIGEDARQSVIDETLAVQMNSPHLSETGLRFMLEMGRSDLAAEHIIAHREELDGNNYYSLPAIADHLIGTGELLAATLILRALIAANLKRANSRYYGHGVRYLVLANRIAPAVQDWRGIQDHAAYFAELQEQHKRKVSFWKKYLARKK